MTDLSTCRKDLLWDMTLLIIIYHIISPGLSMNSKIYTNYLIHTSTRIRDKSQLHISYSWLQADHKCNRSTIVFHMYHVPSGMSADPRFPLSSVPPTTRVFFSRPSRSSSASPLRYLHCSQTRYIFNCRPRFTSNRLSIKFCSSISPASRNRRCASSENRHSTKFNLVQNRVQGLQNLQLSAYKIVFMFFLLSLIPHEEH